jgi:hypothetical protein
MRLAQLAGGDKVVNGGAVAAEDGGGGYAGGQADQHGDRHRLRRQVVRP